MTKKQYIIRALRRASYRTPERNEALKKARVSRGKYLCNLCKQVHPRRNIQLDHIVPCVPIEGTEDFNIIIERMFTDVSGYQCLCKQCHKEKTKKENKERYELRKESKS